MKNLYIDPTTNDLILQNNNLRITTTPQEHLSAKIESNLKTFLGELFTDYTIGIPYFTEVFKKQVDLTNVNTLFSEAIRAIEGVETLLSFTIDYNSITRLYIYTFEVRAASGEIIEGGGAI